MNKLAINKLFCEWEKKFATEISMTTHMLQEKIFLPTARILGIRILYEPNLNQYYHETFTMSTREQVSLYKTFIC